MNKAIPAENTYEGEPCPRGHARRYRLTGRCVTCRTKAVKRGREPRAPKLPTQERIIAERASVTERLAAALQAIGEAPDDVDKIDRDMTCTLCATEDINSFDFLCQGCCMRAVGPNLDPRVREANWMALPARLRAALIEQARGV